MSHVERLRFFATLCSVFTSRKQSSFQSVYQWLTRARSVDNHPAEWRKLTDALDDSLGHTITADTKDLVSEQASKLHEQGIDVVARTFDSYPRALARHLGDRAPLFLWYRGSLSISERSAVGFCGSRHASALGLAVCEDIASQLVQHDVVVVAGYAAGVDQTAHLTALRAGGQTIAVLAEGILTFSVRQLLANDWDWSRTLVVSEFLPQKRWSVAQAMQRNRTILGMGRALVVIEAGQTGGTFEAGKEALAFNHPLYAPIYGSVEGNVVGNKILISRGAIPIMKNRATGRANIDKLLQTVGSDSRSFAVNERPMSTYRFDDESGSS